MILNNIFQIAYITRDIDTAMARFRAQADIRTEVYTDAEVAIKTPAGPEQMHVKLAFMWVGDFQYELIQPISGLDEIYGAYVPADDSLVFHHTCVRVDDWDQLRRDVEKQSLPIAFEGGNGPNYFLYLDARKTLGHFLEYAYLPEEIWAATGGR
jgi:hypothetical protein